MNYKTILITQFLFLLLLPHYIMFGQDNENAKNRFFGLESGFNVQSCEEPNFGFIRSGSSIYASDAATNSISTSFYSWYVGAKGEIRSKDGRVGLLAGVRLKNVLSAIGKLDYYEQADFFYVLYTQEETSTEFLKVKEINQSSYYVGIPIGIRYFPSLEKFRHFFLKATFDTSYRLSTKNDVEFSNSDMAKNQDGILGKFDDPADFISVLYCSAGFVFGSGDNPRLYIEATLPSFYLTENTSSLVNPIAGGGLQISLQIPF